MTIHVDNEMADITGPFHGWCHLWADGTTDTLVELDYFARRLGLRSDWLQASKGIWGDFYHYDISPAKRQQAVRLGAIEIRLRDWIKSKPKANKENR